jgi:hypothetical protein
MKLSLVFKRVILNGGSFMPIEKNWEAKDIGERGSFGLHVQSASHWYAVARNPVNCVVCNCTSPNGNLEQPWRIRSGLQEGIGHLQKAATHDEILH